MNKFRYLILLISLLVVFVTLYSKSLSFRLNILGVTGIESNVVINYAKNNNIKASNKDVTYLIQVEKPSSNEKYINDREFLLNSLFESTTSPYPEFITNTMRCPDLLKPVAIKSNEGIFYKVYANKNYNYGICDESQIEYKSVYKLIDCKRSGVVEIRLFGSDFSVLEDKIDKIKC